MKETEECIKSILHLNEQERIKILIVDNHSTNGSGEKLQKKYLENTQVDILLLDYNYGFSKANNMAYASLTEKEDFRFIVIANNDVTFPQKDFIQLLEQAYAKKYFYVGGPDVYAVYIQEHQSPLADKPRTEKETLERIDLNQKKLRYVKMETVLHFLWLRVNRTNIYKIYRKKKSEREKKRIVKWEKEQDDVVLHGSCLFFSQKFLELNMYPFHPETFFYYEEDILADRCLKNAWKISYIPQIQIHHLEGASTGQNGYYKKMKFRYENMIRSGKVYLEYLRRKQ